MGAEEEGDNQFIVLSIDLSPSDASITLALTLALTRVCYVRIFEFRIA